MKRSLVFCAIALTAVAANSALAAVNVQLNLRYDDPNTEAAGGTWDLLVQSGTAGEGVAGVSAAISDIAGVGAAGTTGWNVFETQTIGADVEIVAGSDLVAPALDVGLPGGTGTGADDLFPGNSPVWDNSALIASGTFGATRPAFTTIASINSTTAANVIDAGNVVTAATMGTLSVRGDSVATDGLIPGDANRDGVVDFLDVSSVSAGFPDSNNPTDWGTGDFDSNGDTDFLDVSTVSANFNVSATPPAVGAAVGAVPEPASLALLGLGGIALACVRHRK